MKQKTIKLLEISTVHGMPNIIQSKRLFSIIMWFFFIIISSIAGSYFAIKNLLDYLKYNTTINLINESEVEFPTISFFIPFFKYKN